MLIIHGLPFGYRWCAPELGKFAPMRGSFLPIHDRDYDHDLFETTDQMGYTGAMQKSTRPDPYLTASEAAAFIEHFGDAYAVVENPGHVYPPYALYPLPPARECLAGAPVALFMDMDGTTTTTEPLCLHALETTAGRITGVDPKKLDLDLAQLVGNSTTRHIEYLLTKCGDAVRPERILRGFIEAAAWTLEHAPEPARLREIRGACTSLGLNDLLSDTPFHELRAALAAGYSPSEAAIDAIANGFGSAVDLDLFANRVRAVVNIYYHRHHYVLGEVAQGRGDALTREILGDSGRRAIEPMPGAGEFIALTKGWLGADAGTLAEPLMAHLRDQCPDICREITNDPSDTLARLGRLFETQPVRVCIVTSATGYEADVALRESCRILSEEATNWPIPAHRRELIQQRFAAYPDCFDGMVTADDSCEIRLKPHPDLYAIALYEMGVMPEAFDRVAGFEDSESGVIAMRAAGMGICCAVPWPETRSHPFEAASHVAIGGLPEVMLRHKLFLPETLLWPD